MLKPLGIPNKGVCASNPHDIPSPATKKKRNLQLPGMKSNNKRTAAQNPRRRRASSISSVETLVADARAKQTAATRHASNREGLSSIMTEYISIQPISLAFSRPDIEASYQAEHVKKYRHRFRPLMLVITILTLVAAIPDIQARAFHRVAVKASSATISLVLAGLNHRVYNDPLGLVLASAVLTYTLLFTRILKETSVGESQSSSSIYLSATEADLGYIFLLFATLGSVIGLGFIQSVAISSLIAVMSIVSIISGPTMMTTTAAVTAVAVWESTVGVLLGFFFFNMVLLRRMEIQERRDFRLTSRLAAENVVVQLQMENFSLFAHQEQASETEDESCLSPGALLSPRARIKVADLEIGETIGVGSYGEVFVAKYRDSTTVAVKKIHSPNDDDDDTVVFEIGKESSLMADLRHPNVVMFMGLCLYPPMIVMEYCCHGSAYSAIHTTKTNLDWSLVLRILLDAATGMAYLHSNDVAHFDLKSLNLLLDENWRCKISDFGLSTLKKKSASSVAGSVVWMAPECFDSSEIQVLTEKVDVYSFGIIMYELLSKSMPYETKPLQGVPFLVSTGKRPTDFNPLDDAKIPSTIRDVSVKLMNSCWAQEPESRPSFTTIVNIIRDEIYPLSSAAIQFPSNNSTTTVADKKSDDENNLKFNIAESELSVGAKIGGGSYGAVYAGKWLGTDVAIKKLFLTTLPDKVRQEFHKECDLMRQLRHPNIVLFVGSSSQPPNLYLVTELLTRGSIFDIYHNSRMSTNLMKHYSTIVLGVAADMARGMAYLHSRSPPLIHRDLKSPNVMVDAHWVSKIGDFGLSRLKDTTKTMTKCGSPLWVAPEVLKGKRFDESCDVYSYGIIVWEVMSWSEPYPDMSSKRVMKEVALHGLRPTIPSHCPEALRVLLLSCWQASPSDRPDFQQVVSTIDEIRTEIGQSSGILSS